MKSKLTLGKIAWVFCILAGIALSLKAIREPDLWWMYRTGEWMLENGQVTKTDPFSYTFAGVDWINVKWLFEILIASLKNLFGVEIIFALQAIVTVLLLTFYYKTANLINQFSTEQEEYVNKPFAGLILVSLLMLYTIDFRLIGRPEMSSHLMVSVYLFLFWNYYYKPSKLIYVLIPLQIIWTNMHEAYGTGVVLMFACLAASWIQHLYTIRREEESEQPYQLTLAVIIAFLCIAINPRGVEMYLHPYNIYTQLADNQFTTELAPIWKSLYWEPQAYLNLFFFVGSLLFVILTPFLYRKSYDRVKKIKATPKGKKKKSVNKTVTIKEKAALDWLPHNLKKYGMANGLLCFMLFYLSITAYRNIPFFIIASAPVFAVAVDKLFSKLLKPKRAYTFVLICSAGLYFSVISGKYHEWSSSRDQYGLQVLTSHNPVGAAQFIQDNNIKGTCFSDYLTSSYLMWKLQPDFKTYIDLRDLDIFPKEFFNDFAKVTGIPDLFEEKDDSLDFNYVVLYRPQFQGLQKHLLQSTEYELIFVDPVACVYIKNKPENSAIIKKYGFTRNGFRDIFSSLKVVESSSIPYFISKLINPFYTPTDYSDTDINSIAGSYFLNLQHTKIAFDRANKAIQSGTEPWNGYELMGNIYNNIAFDPSTNDSLKFEYINQASYHYGKSIDANPDHINAYIGKATLAMQQQDFNTAIFLYHQVLEIEPDYALAIQYLGMCHKILANQSGQAGSDTEMWLKYMLRLDKLNPDNPFIRLDIGIAYCSLGNCEKSVEYLKDILSVPGLPPEELKSGKTCLKKCGG